jgi:hypothetical protein
LLQKIKGKKKKEKRKEKKKGITIFGGIKFYLLRPLIGFTFPERTGRLRGKAGLRAMGRLKRRQPNFAYGVEK